MGKHSDKQSYRKRPKPHGKSWRARSNQVSNVSDTHHYSNSNIFYVRMFWLDIMKTLLYLTLPSDIFISLIIVTAGIENRVVITLKHHDVERAVKTTSFKL